MEHGLLTLMRLPLDLIEAKRSKRPNDAFNVVNAPCVKIAISFALLSLLDMIGKDLRSSSGTNPVKDAAFVLRSAREVRLVGR